MVNKTKKTAIYYLKKKKRFQEKMNGLILPFFEIFTCFIKNNRLVPYKLCRNL